MHLPQTIKFKSQAGDEWMKRKLAEDDLSLPDYERPLKDMGRTKSPFITDASRIGFGRQVYKFISPLIP